MRQKRRWKKNKPRTYPLFCAASNGAFDMKNSKDKTTIIFFWTFLALNSFSSHWIRRYPQTFSSENHSNSMTVEYGYPLLSQYRLKWNFFVRGGSKWRKKYQSSKTFVASSHSRIDLLYICSRAKRTSDIL